MEHKLQVIHPFPARMAPEIVLDRLAGLAPGSRLLDPMCGSGTVLRAGVEAGLQVVGSDIDPLAVLMAKVWCSPIDRSRLLHDAHALLETVDRIRGADAELLPWADDETVSFIDFWFAEPQRSSLYQIAGALAKTDLTSADALRVALSRIIVTKDRGASLGRDISHSRPHKVATENDFDVPGAFLKSVRAMASKLRPELVLGSSQISVADGRELTEVSDGSIDCIVTSPPYLNAIDYLRGHRLSLVWLGYRVEELRRIRSGSIGAERVLRDVDHDARRYVSHERTLAEAPDKIAGWSARYLRDARLAATQFARVLRAGGDVVLVVGNSRLKGFVIDNAQIYSDELHRAGLTVVEAKERHIPTRNRYLPTPSDKSALASRMRTEMVITARQPLEEKTVSVTSRL